MNMLRFVDDGRFSAETAVLASGSATSVGALPAVRGTRKTTTPVLRVLPNSSPGKATRLSTTTLAIRAGGLWEDIVFVALIVSGVASVIVALIEAFRM